MRLPSLSFFSDALQTLAHFCKTKLFSDFQWDADMLGKAITVNNFVALVQSQQNRFCTLLQIGNRAAVDQFLGPGKRTFTFYDVLARYTYSHTTSSMSCTV